MNPTITETTRGNVTRFTAMASGVKYGIGVVGRVTDRIRAKCHEAIRRAIEAASQGAAGA